MHVKTGLMLAVALLCTSTLWAGTIQYLDPESSFTSPTVTACTAYGSMSQACRRCQRNFDQNGNAIGWGCAPTAENASCACSFKYSCGEVGTCTYR
jgi:hypothetical protein